MTIERIAFRTAMRAAAVELMKDYASSVSLGLTVYRGRPRSINAPEAFVDSIRETFDYPGNVTYRLRRPILDIVLIHRGDFDSGEAVDQADTFADSFLDWVTDRYHAAGANTTVGVAAIEDEPTYVPDWIAPALQRTYYATRITLEGFAGG